MIDCLNLIGVTYNAGFIDRSCRSIKKEYNPFSSNKQWYVAMNSTTTINETISSYFLTRELALEKIGRYGFVEIADAQKFLKVMCDVVLDSSDLAYLRKKIDACLRHHDNGTNYFVSLREFATELDCLIDINLR